MEIKISKFDIIWSYAAQFFNLGTGFISLPLILKLLSADEVGLNYILLSINSIIALFDMGFSAQFARNITYVLSGAQEIRTEGIASEYKSTINEPLYATIIMAAKSLYRKISMLVLIPLLTVGSYYIWKITDGFEAITYSLPIWIIFCLSCYFNLLFLYLNAFLLGKGMVMESKKAQVYSRIIQLAILFTMLMMGCGLISVVIANLISPFVFRYYAQRKFFDAQTKKIITTHRVKKKEKQDVFWIIFYNAKKMGIIGIFASVIGYASTLIIGAFLSLSEVASYGLMVQLIGIIAGISITVFTSLSPEIGSMMIQQNNERVKKLFGSSLAVFYIVQLMGLIVILLLPPIFEYFRFNAQLPVYSILITYYIYKFLEQNQSLYSTLLLIGNDLCFYSSAIWTGIVSLVCMFIALYLGMGLNGVIISQAVPLCLYSAWKWPIFTTNKYGILFYEDIVAPAIKNVTQIWKTYLTK